MIVFFAEVSFGRKLLELKQTLFSFIFRFDDLMELENLSQSCSFVTVVVVIC